MSDPFKFIIYIRIKASEVSTASGGAPQLRKGNGKVHKACKKRWKKKREL